MGGLGVLAWLFMAPLPGLPSVDVPAFTGVALWSVLVLIATHFGISLHLAYGQGRAEVGKHPVTLVVIPVLLGAFALAVVGSAFLGHSALAESGTRMGLVAVYSLTTWHYVKQTYGVARLGASLHGLRLTAGDARILRYGIYPLWLLDASSVWMAGYEANDYGFDASYSLLPSGTGSALRVVSVVAAFGVVVAMVRLTLRWRRFPPATVWAPYAAAVLWIGFQPDHLSTLLVLGGVHALQYLACAHRAELSWGVERGEGSARAWWGCVFGFGLATGMLLTYWAPTWLGSFGGERAGLVPAAMLFVVFNLHHYAIDAGVWRSPDGHVRRIVAGPRSADSSQPSRTG